VSQCDQQLLNKVALFVGLAPDWQLKYQFIASPRCIIGLTHTTALFFVGDFETGELVLAGRDGLPSHNCITLHLNNKRLGKVAIFFKMNIKGWPKLGGLYSSRWYRFYVGRVRVNKSSLESKIVCFGNKMLRCFIDSG
jgi:hypothetical protein